MQMLLSTIYVSSLQEHCVEEFNSIKKGCYVQACCQSTDWTDSTLYR
jgi:hypothetical protein